MIAFIVIEFAISVAVGWMWQTIRYYRLLARATPCLYVPTIANTSPPSIRETR